MWEKERKSGYWVEEDGGHDKWILDVAWKCAHIRGCQVPDLQKYKQVIIHLSIDWNKPFKLALYIVEINILVGNLNASKLALLCDILAGKSSQFPGLREGGGGGGRICLQN